MMEQRVEDSALATRLAATANPQLSSSFFSVLPAEIRRMIYVEYWRHNCLYEDAGEHTSTGDSTHKYHIINKVRFGSTVRYTHSPCVVSDQNSHDFRMGRLDLARGQDSEVHTWARRIETDWAVHWPCEELYKNTTRRPQSTFMPALLTCKLMYRECIESIYENLTFVFTDTTTAESFIDLHPPPTLRSLELCIRLPVFLTELYCPPSFQHHPRVSSPDHPGFDAHDNPWATLCNALAHRITLRRLNIWLDIQNLRAWDERVWERRLLKPLAAVSVPRECFTLALPELGPLGKGRGEKNGRTYLEGEYLDRAPFEVKRAPRPNYTEAYLARMLANTTLLTIDAGPAHGGAT
ncbi:hypothetical protein CONLIGDRAFT_632525 [Coniochaeta ligniaria NRRL 30616]|uniref:DUF7730 domain-containing protein n=1 Tax=Coniochaeta ligniaria NRRL 30616 TaxID=1408157 RepID=A0A1J7JG91_9PEZI|nr:hypothetical protein CONLIGDRAFT_632525 [Coniochaeta ligniaria NRRL 30616]